VSSAPISDDCIKYYESMYSYLNTILEQTSESFFPLATSPPNTPIIVTGIKSSILSATLNPQTIYLNNTVACIKIRNPAYILQSNNETTEFLYFMYGYGKIDCDINK